MTESWIGAVAQVGKAAVPTDVFPVLANYAGLLAQLVDLLGDDSLARDIPLVYVGLGALGHATVKDRTADSLIVGLDSHELRAKLTRYYGAGGRACSSLRNSLRAAPRTGRKDGHCTV